MDNVRLVAHSSNLERMRLANLLWQKLSYFENLELKSITTVRTASLNSHAEPLPIHCRMTLLVANNYRELFTHGGFAAYIAN